MAILLEANEKIALIDSDDIGHTAATILTPESFSLHKKAKYILVGTENITGQEMVDLVEQYTGLKAKVFGFGISV